MDIDVQGVKAIKEVDDIPRSLYVFMKPPSLKILEERLRARGTETEESLQKVMFHWYHKRYYQTNIIIINIYQQYV